MNPKKPSGSVLGAAVVAILGSVLALVSISFTLVALLFVSPQQGNLELPASFRLLGQIMMIVFLCVAGFGLATGINLIRLKNWARISALVWAGIALFFGTISLISIMFMPFPENVSTTGPVNMHYVKTMLAVVYGIPIIVSVWWLILFNQKNVKQQFTGTQQIGEQPVPVSPRCPLPVAIIAGFNLFSVAGMFLLPLMHMPIFLILFGHRLRGELGGFFFAFNAMLYLVASIGLLTLKRWSYPLLMALTAFWTVNSLVSFLSPGYLTLMEEYSAELHMPEASNASIQLMQNRGFALFAVVPGIIYLGLLLYYRTRFLQACAAAESKL